MLGPHGKPPKTQAMQHVTDRTLSHDDAEFLLDLICQIGPSPAYNTVLAKVRAVLHPLRHYLLLLNRQQRRWAGGVAVAQPRQTLSVVPVHPVSKGLTVHAARRRSISPAMAI
jgi:hypothetical protein